MTMKLFYFVALVTVTMAIVVEQKDGNDDDVLVMLKEMQREIAQLKTEGKSLRDQRQMDANTLFLATLSEGTVSIEDGDPIIWDSAPINPGGHFNTVLGMYEAPVNGYYQFSVTKRGNNYQGSFYFLVDEVRYAFKDAYYPNSYEYQASSATINVELTAGQVVRVENHEATEITGAGSDGSMQSWFTGHLLYAL